MPKYIKSTLSNSAIESKRPKVNQSVINKKNLVSAISLALSFSVNAAELNVTEPNDNGTGLIANTLSWAILQANTTAGDDVITLNIDVKIIGVMKRLIDSNTTIHSDETRRTIDGDNKFRPLFIKSGNVIIENVDMVNGLAQGGSAKQGGAGVGMGGSLFIYNGNVGIENVVISNSKAIAGQILSSVYNQNGAGGMFGDALGNGGGGLFESSSSNYGAYGGYGEYRSNDPKFGEGGGEQFSYNNTAAGFGGGGGSTNFSLVASNGGFGGGGGYGTYGGKNGGFGGGGGNSGYGYIAGSSGYGGSSRYAAGMGGAIFIRSGNLDLYNVTIENSQANATNNALGLGGALFILHSTTNSNGNNQSMPIELPTVGGCGLIFNGNSASGDTNTGNNNDNIFDLANNFNYPDDCSDNLIFKNGFEFIKF